MNFLIQTMISRSSSTFKINTEVLNLSSDTTQYQLFNDFGFSFGVSLVNINGKSVLIDPTYFDLSI